MTFASLDTWWWPFVFILIAGYAATDLWRYAGVLLGNRLDESSQAFVLVRAIATALVAAVIARLIVHPSGQLAETSVWLRTSAAILGFASFQLAGQRIIVGISVALAILVAGMVLGY